jgi:hypothetical protein
VNATAVACKISWAIPLLARERGICKMGMDETVFDIRAQWLAGDAPCRQPLSLAMRKPMNSTTR